MTYQQAGRIAVLKRRRRMGNFHSRADFNTGFCTEVYMRSSRKELTRSCSILLTMIDMMRHTSLFLTARGITQRPIFKKWTESCFGWYSSRFIIHAVDSGARMSQVRHVLQRLKIQLDSWNSVQNSNKNIEETSSGWYEFICLNSLQ